MIRTGEAALVLELALVQPVAQLISNSMSRVARKVVVVKAAVPPTQACSALAWLVMQVPLGTWAVRAAV